MIIFYNKNSGDIIATIDGRIHSRDELNMTIGDPRERRDIERIVVQWRMQASSAQFEPDHEQKDLMIHLDKTPSDIYKYKVRKNKLILKK
jgi:hypothetical protein